MLYDLFADQIDICYRYKRCVRISFLHFENLLLTRIFYSSSKFDLNKIIIDIQFLEKNGSLMDQLYGPHLNFCVMFNVNRNSTFVSIKFIHPIFKI
jgi:hypothetical protein